MWRKHRPVITGMIAVPLSEGHTGILPVYRSWSRRLLDNNLVLASSTDELLKSTKKALGNRFEMTDMCQLKYFPAVRS